MYFVTSCPLELYLGSEPLLAAFSALGRSVDADSLLASWVKVAGEDAGFRLKRPMVGRGSCDVRQWNGTGDSRKMGRAPRCEETA